MNLIKTFFKPKKNKTGIIFIVEDDLIYAKTLENFLKTQFPDLKEIKTFRVGEIALLEIHKRPDLIIMDYYLNSKYEDAETGLEIIKQIREIEPELNIVVLSTQQDIDVALEAVEKLNCNYVKKNFHAFEKIAEILKSV